VIWGLLAAAIVVVAIGIGYVVLRPRSGSTAFSSASAGSTASTGSKIDAFAVSEPWRQHVQTAITARRRMGEVAAATRPGPIQDRLNDIATDVDRIVAKVWDIAVQGNQLAKADRRIANASSTNRLIALQAELAAADPDARDAIERSIASLEAVEGTSQRLGQQREAAANQLREMDTRLDELVARAAEVSTAGVEADSVDTLRSDMDALVIDLEALRQGLAETRGTATQ
jgi:hypothetical protein